VAPVVMMPKVLLNSKPITMKPKPALAKVLLDAPPAGGVKQAAGVNPKPAGGGGKGKAKRGNKGRR